MKSNICSLAYSYHNTMSLRKCIVYFAFTSHTHSATDPVHGGSHTTSNSVFSTEIVAALIS